jgi:hypothetical protein
MLNIAHIWDLELCASNPTVLLVWIPGHVNKRSGK